jgi:hypothetical protein
LIRTRSRLRYTQTAHRLTQRLLRIQQVARLSGSGYTAGGNTLTVSKGITGGTAFITFADTSWSAAITARGALIYKDGGATVCVLDFGSDKTSTTTFSVDFPAASSTDALIRLS